MFKISGIKNDSDDSFFVVWIVALMDFYMYCPTTLCSNLSKVRITECDLLSKKCLPLAITEMLLDILVQMCLM